MNRIPIVLSLCGRLLAARPALSHGYPTRLHKVEVVYSIKSC